MYDNETGFYYLNSRYYDPSICRFINEDTLISIIDNLSVYNLFSYCMNNPITHIDTEGTVPDDVLIRNAELYAGGANIIMCGNANNVRHKGVRVFSASGSSALGGGAMVQISYVKTNWGEDACLMTIGLGGGFGSNISVDSDVLKMISNISDMSGEYTYYPDVSSIDELLGHAVTVGGSISIFSFELTGLMDSYGYSVGIIPTNFKQVIGKAPVSAEFHALITYTWKIG